jgi:tetratricopeptide (TPR) repeat protein
LFSEGGLPTWDIDFDEARPTGLSLSANGSHLAVSLRDGTVIEYELHYGERFAALDSAQVMQEAQAARESGNWQGAVMVLKERLTAVPTDSPVCVLLSETLSAFREFALAAATNAEAVGDFGEADARFADLLAADPTDATTVTHRSQLRKRWSTAALVAGREAVTEGSTSVAEARFLDAIAADPLNIEAREALAAIRRTAASTAIEKGRTLLRMGQFAEAIVALTEAQRRGAHGPDLTALLRDARVGEALVAGNALYQDRQYAAALFQYKKVLRLDPDNAEAKQKVSYAQNFLQDNQLNERFSRLE